MNPSTTKPGAKLLTIPAASAEYGLTQGMLRGLIQNGNLAAVRPPNARRVYRLRDDLERKIASWREVVR